MINYGKGSVVGKLKKDDMYLTNFELPSQTYLSVTNEVDLNNALFDGVLRLAFPKLSVIPNPNEATVLAALSQKDIGGFCVMLSGEKEGSEIAFML